MRKNSFTTALSLAVLLLLVPAMHGQAVYAAKENFRAQAGFGWMILDNDYTTRKVQGPVVWGDVDLTQFKSIRIGAEIEGRWGSIITPDDIAEDTYLFGPRFSYQRRKLNVYGKILFGRGTITNQNLNQSSSYNVIPAYGGGVEYRVGRKINIRAVDVEIQKWPDFEPNTLSPLAITFGASYTIR